MLSACTTPTLGPSGGPSEPTRAALTEADWDDCEAAIRGAALRVQIRVVGVERDGDGLTVHLADARARAGTAVFRATDAGIEVEIAIGRLGDAEAQAELLRVTRERLKDLYGRGAAPLRQ